MPKISRSCQKEPRIATCCQKVSKSSQNLSQFAKSCQKFLQVGKNCHRLPNVPKSFNKLQKLPKRAKSCLRLPNGAKNFFKFLKIAKSSHRLPKGATRYKKMPQNALSCQKLLQIAKVSPCSPKNVAPTCNKFSPTLIPPFLQHCPCQRSRLMTPTSFRNTLSKNQAKLLFESIMNLVQKCCAVREGCKIKQARNLRRCALKAGKTLTRKTENLAHLTYPHTESGMR